MRSLLHAASEGTLLILPVAPPSAAGPPNIEAGIAAELLSR